MWKLVRFTGVLIWIVYLTFKTDKVQAFLRDHVSYMDIPSDDYTLRDLTKETLTRVVARYFEESNPERYNSGDLLELDSLTASSLFAEHFGGKLFFSSVLNLICVNFSYTLERGNTNRYKNTKLSQN